MIPFRNTLPYDIQMNDVYAALCPFCGSANVRLPLRPEDVRSFYGGARKYMLVFPCCNGRMRIVDADSDYLLSNKPLRRD